MSSLNQADKATLLLLVNFVYGFYSGPAPLLASDTSKSLSKPLHPLILLTVLLFECPVDSARGVAFCGGFPLIMELFALAQS